MSLQQHTQCISHCGVWEARDLKYMQTLPLSCGDREVVHKNKQEMIQILIQKSEENITNEMKSKFTDKLQ